MSDGQAVPADPRGLGRAAPVRPSTRGGQEALADLIRISREVGRDPDLVQGGGGNTSVKTADGRAILIKASGTALAEMNDSRGWVELSLSRLRRILSVARLLRLPAAEREREVLRLLGKSVVVPLGSRPSVESSLHALLDRVVIHSHPVGLNAFLCSRGSRVAYMKAVGSGFWEPLYVPYVDPGFILAQRVEREIAEYCLRAGKLPSVMLLENHGLFVSAPETQECFAIHRSVCRAAERYMRLGRVNPFAFEVIPRGGSGLRRHGFLAGTIRSALLAARCSPLLVHRDREPIARRFIRLPEAPLAALQGAFTPDQIVYCRTSPLVLDSLPEDGDGASWYESSVRLARRFRKRFGLDPRVVIVPRSGVYYAAKDLAQLRTVAEVYRGAMAVFLRAPRTGGPRFLTSRQTAFIESWEVEAFRARLAAGEGDLLDGRVNLIVDGGDPLGPFIETGIETGATLAVVTHRPRLLHTLGRRLGEKYLGILVRDASERTAGRVLESLFAELGGADLAVFVGPGPLAAAFGRALSRHARRIED